MSRLTWDSPRNYEAGLDRGVFYPKNAPGESWSGLVSVDESFEVDEQVRYIDGVKIQSRKRAGEFTGSIESFTYPEALEDFLVTNQGRQVFDLSYRTKTDDSSKIHLVYNVLITPAMHIYQYGKTETFSWGFTTSPVVVPGAARSAHLIIEAADAYSWTLEALEDILYGSDANAPSLPSPTAIFEVFEENSILRIIDHGDGSWTAIGPDSAIEMLDPTTFEITWPSAVYISADAYTIHSL